MWDRKRLVDRKGQLESTCQIGGDKEERHANQCKFIQALLKYKY